MEEKLFAQWIWLKAAPKEECFVRARKNFSLPRRPRTATLRITASGHYRLWVNGIPVARGPARANLWKKRYDVLEIAPYLHRGKNVLAVQIIHYGYATAHSPAAPGGFWCQLEAGALSICTDKSWRISLDPAYLPHTGRRNRCYGPIEIYDARLGEDWQSLGYDDSSWPHACVLTDRYGAGPKISPWVDLIPRGIPQCHEETLFPTRIIFAGEVIAQEFIPDMMGSNTVPNLATFLLHDVPLPAEHTSIEHAEGLLMPGLKPTVITQPSPLDRSSRQRCATLILDFGREITGYAWLDVEGNKGAIVDLAYGEGLVGGRVQAVVQNTAYADRYILREGRQRHEVYDWKGFRYLQLTFRNLTRPLYLHGVGVTFSTYPVKYRGSFQSSDPLLERIWRTGAYTQQLCMHDALMDCPWREQRQWLGDGRIQLLIVQNAFGDRAMPRKFLEQFAEAQLPSGMLPCVTPGREDAIIDYSLWWIQGLVDVLLFDRDLAFTRQLFPTLVRLLRWFDAHRNNEGLLENVPGWVFIDWAAVGKEGICAPLNAMYAIALRNASEIARLLDHPSLAAEWEAKALAISQAFHRHFWNKERGLYVDNIIEGSQTDNFSQHTQAMAVLAGLCQVKARDLLRRALQDERIVQTEPYFSFYLLEALAQVGLAQEGLNFIRQRWGNMLAQGATTFWEEWQLEGTFREGYWIPRPRSHCHAWSAAPTAWLSRYILGVRPKSPLEEKLILSPNPCDLTYAQGTVPTSCGLVHVQWKVQENELRIRVSPKGLPLELREPLAFQGHVHLEES